MKKRLLASAGGLNLLCLFIGLSPSRAVPAVSMTDNLSLESSEKIIAPTNSKPEKLIHEDISNPDNLRLTLEEKRGVKGKGEISMPSYKAFSSQTTLNRRSLVLAQEQKIASASDASPEANSPGSEAMDQVTSVSQLSDVKPTDWAFQALQSLVERYGCIVGYPNSTYRGNRALTRYEFAAGLNACLNRVNELIAAATSDLVRKEDLATLQRLQEEFATELTTLRGRVDTLEVRTAQLESQQFSTTTKLNGQAIISAESFSGGPRGATTSNTILVDRVRLNLTTSFTGKDALITGLQAYNFSGGGSSVGDVLGIADPAGLSVSSAKLSFEPQFAGVNPLNLSPVGANSIQLYKLLYVFPVAQKLTLFAGTAAETTDAFPAITPFADEGQEAISRFAGYNPVVRVSGGTSETGLASAAGLIYNFSDKVSLAALYGSVNASLPVKSPLSVPGLGVSTTPLGAGLFGGSNVAAAQLTLRPTKSIDAALNYAHNYDEFNLLGTGLVKDDIVPISGIRAENPTQTDSVGGTLTWRFAPKIAFSTYAAALFVRGVSTPATRVNASTTFTSWMLGLHFADLFKEGNGAGIIFGQPLFRTSVGGSALFKDAPTDRRNTPYHLEGYYRFRVSDNISITPGAFVLFNPESNSRNQNTVVGVLRTTFSF